MEFPAWRQLLQGARKREGRDPSKRWLQLATVAADGTPRVRTIVFRGWAGHAELDLYSDDRSSKADQLRHQPKAELCWLLPKARHQYRLRGTIRMLSPASAAPACQTAWESMSAGGRALWFWPSPGDPLRDERESDFPLQVEPNRDLPPHFLILRLDIDQVELLDLSRNPHRRLRWIRQDGWQETRINS